VTIKQVMIELPETATEADVAAATQRLEALRPQLTCDTMLARAADYLEREFDRFTATAMALLEPLIIVVMGVIVALIILSILLPILQLQQMTGP